MGPPEQFKEFLSMLAATFDYESYREQLASLYQSESGWWEHRRDYQRHYADLDAELRLLFGLPRHLRDRRALADCLAKGWKIESDLRWRMSMYRKQLLKFHRYWGRECALVELFWEQGRHLVQVVGQEGSVEMVRQQVLAERAVELSLRLLRAKPADPLVKDNARWGIDYWGFGGRMAVRVRPSRDLERPIALHTSVSAAQLEQALGSSPLAHWIQQDFTRFFTRLAQYNGEVPVRMGLLVAVGPGHLHDVGMPHKILTKVIGKSIKTHCQDEMKD